MNSSQLLCDVAITPNVLSMLHQVVKAWLAYIVDLYTLSISCFQKALSH
jgi:hypothetical protein